ncbi:hypothetical protein ACROYT_G031859 [Oculina patagonica]
MVESFNKLSSSMSSVMGAQGSSAWQPGRPSSRGPGAAGQRGTGRGGGKGGGRGAGRGTGKGAGKGPGRPPPPPPRPPPPGVNTPLINPKGKADKSKTAANNATKVKRKKQKKKKAGKDTSELLPEETSTLPSLCRFFKKPQRQQGAHLPSKNFRKQIMCHSWEGGVVELNALDDIQEEDEEGHE